MSQSWVVDPGSAATLRPGRGRRSALTRNRPLTHGPGRSVRVPLQKLQLRRVAYSDWRNGSAESGGSAQSDRRGVDVTRRPNIYRAEMWEPQAMGGASDVRIVGLKGYAKLNSAEVPNCVANEYIASGLAQVIRLPVPPGAVIQAEGQGDGVAWVGLSFAPGAIRLPPVNPPEVVAALPDLSAEVVVFDILIQNPDRSAGNLAFQPSKSQLEVFDHSHALLGPDGGVARFRAWRDELVIEGRSPYTRHCLINHLRRAGQVRAAIEAVGSFLRDRAIERRCQEAAQLGLLPEGEAVSLGYLLKERRDRLESLILDHRQEFSGIETDRWWI